MIGSLFAGTDESPGEVFYLMDELINPIEGWDHLAQWEGALLIDIFKKN